MERKGGDAGEDFGLSIRVPFSGLPGGFFGFSSRTAGRRSTRRLVSLPANERQMIAYSWN